MSNILDTPHNFASSKHSSKFFMHQKQKAKDVQRMVDEELKGHVQVCDTDQFLEHVLPVMMVEDILNRVQEENSYSEKEKRWLAFPNKFKKENELYKPFIEMAESIRTVIPEDQVKLQGIWLDRHDLSPKASDEDLADTRPDCLFVPQRNAVPRLENMIRSLEKISSNSSPEQNTRKRQLDEELGIWWRNIHVPVEIKRDKTWEAFSQAITQACSYLRYVFREQLDRRFAIALVLCANELTVLLVDRSGLVYTKTPINIHEYPEKFIQVIAALSVLDPQDIGWDSQMKLYDPESGEARASYLAADESKFWKRSLFDIHWEIDIPSKNGGREKVITIAALSINRSEAMYGRATLVWEVIRKTEDLNVDEIFVLKRYWRPYQEPRPMVNPVSMGENRNTRLSYLPEGDRYERVWKDRIYSSEDIQIDTTQGPKNDSTFGLIRPELDLDHTAPNNINLSRKRPNNPRLEHVIEHHRATSDKIEHGFLSTATEDMVSRVHTQIIHAYTGWPLRHFKHLGELLHVIRDVVADHKELYYAGGILHRDISVENIIILPKKNQTGQATGCLIDLDHSKISDSSKELKSVNIKPERFQELETYCNHTLKSPVRKDVIEKYLLFDARGDEAYIKAVIATRRKFFELKTRQTGHEINLADLGWDRDVQNPPDFTKHVPRSGKQTGTPPFMSVEVLKTANLYTRQDIEDDIDGEGDISVDPWFHDAVHDMESLFWVLTFICLTRKGPGANMYRDQLMEQDNNNLKDLIHNLFDHDDKVTILMNKEAYFLRPDKFRSEIVANYDQYFQDLEKMMHQWRRILILAYDHRKFEYWTIHDQIIDILDRTIKDLPRGKCDDNDAETKNEMTRREQVRNNRLKDFKARNRAAPVTKFDGLPDSVGETIKTSPDRPIYNGPSAARYTPESPTPTRVQKKQRL